MSAIYGLYPDAAAAQAAVDGLRAAGVAGPDITVLTSFPMDGCRFFDDGSDDRVRRRMWTMAGGGGLTGLTAAFALSWVAETSWPLSVGGLPVFAWWPNLIIMFELTMLGAMLATVVTLVVGARLGRRVTLYDPEVSRGHILVGIERPDRDRIAALTRALAAPAGARLGGNAGA